MSKKVTETYVPKHINQSVLAQINIETAAAAILIKNINKLSKIMKSF